MADAYLPTRRNTCQHLPTFTKRNATTNQTINQFTNHFIHVCWGVSRGQKKAVVNAREKSWVATTDELAGA